MKGFIDLHCDTIVCEVMRGEGKNLRHNPEGMLDLERMKKGNSLLQCLAIFIPTKQLSHYGENFTAWDFFNMAADVYDREVAANSDLIRPVLKYEDVERNFNAGYMSVMMTVEDGVPLEGDIARLDEMHRRGVRIITLTWNNENSLGFPNCSDPDKGLKPFGIEALRRMEEIGIIADVSHLSDAGFWDVVKYGKMPFVATHSNARALCPVCRNLTDDMLRALAARGGVTGLNFSADFLVDEARHTNIADIVRHARYIADVAGVETVAMGSDFDGISCTLEFKDCAGFPMIEEALNTVFTAREVDLITHGNALRVMRDCFK